MRYLLIFGLGLVVSIHSVLSKTEACDHLAECLKRAEEKYEECQDILEERNDTRNWTGQNDANQCRRELKELMKGRQAVQRQRTQEYGQCIAKRLEDAIKLTKEQAKQCEELLWKAKDGSKRQADKEEIKRRREERRKQRRRAERKKIVERFRKCMREQQALKQTCTPFIRCCSESAICHEYYELSETHDRIKRFNLDILLKKRECQTQKRQDEEEEEEKIQDSDIVSDEQIINDVS